MKLKILHFWSFFMLFLLSISPCLLAQDLVNFKEIKGIIRDAESKTPLIFADLNISNSNVSTVSNSDGEFLLKIPMDLESEIIIVTYLGYEEKQIPIKSLESYNELELLPVITELEAVSITSTKKTAREMVVETLSKKGTLYNNNSTLMTAFYRETIKKRRKNASLSEAVVKIHKKPYDSFKNDQIELVKARKNTDYSRLDTIALKLQGGPFSNLYTDIIKYPEFIFTEEDIDSYQFSYDQPTRINDNLVYVINFKQLPQIKYPLYYGKLYIDANTLALNSAVYRLNIENKELSSQMFIRKKPKKVDVYPTETMYRVNYRTKNGKWHYAYSHIALSFKVNWTGKLFNSTYSLISEMAITDWEIYEARMADVKSELLRPTTILTEKASGFSDPRFWGEYNIIEPEKSIESAIKKIQRQLKRT